MKTNRIAFLLVVVAIAAVGFAAFRSAGRPWASHVDLVIQSLFLLVPGIAFEKRWRSPGLIAFALVGFAFAILPWPIDSSSARPNWLEARIDRLSDAIDPEKRPSPTPPKLMADRKPGSTVTAQEIGEYIKACAQYKESFIEWSVSRHTRISAARRIARGWLALAMGGLAAFAAGILLARPLPKRDGPSDQDAANRRADGSVPAEVPMTADPGSASLADIEQ